MTGKLRKRDGKKGRIMRHERWRQGNRADGRWQEEKRTSRVVFHCLDDSADNDPLDNCML